MSDSAHGRIAVTSPIISRRAVLKSFNRKAPLRA
jgi:hypothetical protein